jgi:cysteine desulfurase
MPVYFDHNATTPLAPEVMDAMLPYMSSIYGNPSSVHRYGRLARNALELARQQVADLLGAQTNQVVFTSGGTEANNLALKGSLQAHQPARLALSTIEHAAMLGPAAQLEQAGWQLDMIPVDRQGVVTEAALQQTLSPQTELVSVMAANNETGVLQNLSALISTARSVREDLLFHSDACQVAGKLPLNFSELGLDMLTLSAHKLYGPQGAGALIVSRRIDLQPQISGGGQESGRRSGTENLAAIVGFGQAAELAALRQQQREQQALALRQQLQQGLIEQPGITVFSVDADRLPNTLQFSVAGIDGETLLMQLDKKGFAVSSGSACQSGKTEPSHVLLAMQIDPAVAKGSIRVSFGEQNTQAQVAQFIEALAQIRQQFN